MYYYPFSCILKPILKGWKTFLVVINLMEELVELGFTSRQKLEIKMMADFLSYLNSSKHLSKAYTILFITKKLKVFSHPDKKFVLRQERKISIYTIRRRYT